MSDGLGTVSSPAQDTGPEVRLLTWEEQRRQTVMLRRVDWWHIVFVAAGAPALVMFNLGGLSAVAGTVAPLAWTVSVLIGFVECFIYAEMAGLHPRKSGGTSVFGATAWFRYSKIMSVTSIWSNWLAWTPILAIGSGLAAGYIISVFVPADASINTWQITLIDLGFMLEGLTVRIDLQYIVAFIIMVSVWTLQHAGILRTAKAQIVLTLAALVPLVVVSIIPLFQGHFEASNFSPFVPMNGSWNIDGWRIFIGSLFLAAWSTYGYETAISYMSELRDPEKDGAKAIIWSGALCVGVYMLVPVVFQGVLGVEYMTTPGLQTGEGVGVALASMLEAGAAITKFVVIILIFTLILAAMTAMAGSARTIYQGGRDGWLPKYLDQLNKHKVPTNAMWTDLTVNACILLMSDYLFVLAISCVNYVFFHFINLNAGWIHRKDNALVPRPYRCPQPLYYAGIVISYFNMFLIGAGANLWGAWTLPLGLGFAFLGVPVMYYRHYVTDKGRYPDCLTEDLLLEGQTELGPKKAGFLPYVALAGGAACLLAGYLIFWQIWPPAA